jgi:hypothetical protein
LVYIKRWSNFSQNQALIFSFSLYNFSKWFHKTKFVLTKIVKLILETIFLKIILLDAVFSASRKAFHTTCIHTQFYIQKLSKANWIGGIGSISIEYYFINPIARFYFVCSLRSGAISA